MARVKLTPVQIGLLSISVLMLIAAVIGLSVFFGSSTSHRRATQPATEPLGSDERLPGLSRTSEYAFNVSDNLRVCGLRTELVALSPSLNDYSARINASAQRLSAMGGGTLALEAGVYPLSRPLRIPSRVCVRGKGMRHTMLRMLPLSAPFAQAGMLRVDNAERVSLIDFTVDGANASQSHDSEDARYGRYGLYATEFSHLWVRGVRATRHRSYGFDPHGTRTTWSHFLVMEGCVADHNGLDGFTLDQTRHISLLDSNATDNFRHGINIVTGSADVLVRRFYAENNGVDPARKDVGCGIIVQNNAKELQTRDCVLDGNTLVDSPRAGVCVSDSVNVTISRTNTTIVKFADAPCYLFRHSRDIVIKDSSCRSLSGRRVSTDETSRYQDNRGDSNGLPAARAALAGTDSDPMCKYGIQNKDVCCPPECGRCGGKGCGLIPVAKKCCTAAILDSKMSCDNTHAPCVMSPAYLKPTPHVHISIAPSPTRHAAVPETTVATTESP